MKSINFIAKLLLALFVSAMFLICFSCEKEVVYTQIPQREIPTELMNEKESAMVVITNDYRIADGLPKYKTSLHLYHIAVSRVLQMIDRDSLSHYGFYPGYEESGALYYGESISYNFITAESNVAGFRASENHWPMFVSPIYEYIAIACQNNYTVVLVARWRPYNSNVKRELEITQVRTDNLITTEIKP